MKKRKAVRKKKSATTRKNTSSHAYLAIVVMSLVLLFAALNIQTTNSLGLNSQSSVLGEEEHESEENKQEDEGDNKGSENKQEDQKKQEEQQSEDQKKQEEAQKEAAKSTGSTSRTETTSFGGLQMKTQSEGNKQETEVETADGQKIKTKVEDDGSTKIEVEQGGFKLKYVIENGKTVLKVENEEGEETDVTDDRLAELVEEAELELEDKDVKIASRGGQISLAKNNVIATTAFPLSINVTTKQLVVTTPAGQKVVAILPDQAIANLLATGVVNQVDQAPSGGDPDELSDNVQIELRNGEVVYKVKGLKKLKILGIFPVTTPVTAFVSAQSGIPVASQQSILSRVIDALSP